MKTLIVEDDMMSQCLLAKILAERGHEVVSYDNAEQAILAYQKEFYPLLFVDVDLPGMDGLHFCKWVRAQTNGDKVFIMVATSSGQPEDLGEVLTVGANDFLPKPYDVGALGVRLTIAEHQMGEFFERKKLEDALRDSELSCNRAYETANDGVCVLDDRFRTQYVNPQMAAMLGYQAEELLDRAVVDFLPEPAQREAEQLLARQREGKEIKKEIHFRRKDGSACLALLSAAPVRADDGEFKGALWMVNDLTGRKNLETELADARKKFEAQYRQASGELNSTRTSLQTESAERKKVEQTLLRVRAESEARLRAESADRGRVADELKSEVAARRKLEAQISKARDELAARVQEFSAELKQTKDGLQAEVHRRKESEDALRQLRKQLETQLQQQKDELTRSVKELKAEQAAKKQADEALQKARLEIELRSKHHADEIARADKSLQTEVAERKRLAEALRTTQLESEFRDKQQADTLARAEQALQAEAVERKRLADELLNTREDVARRVKEHMAEMVKADEELKAALAERKQVEEMLSRVRDGAELQVSQQASELSRAGQDLQTEAAGRRGAEEALQKAREEFEARAGELAAQLDRAKQELCERALDRIRAEEAQRQSEEKFQVMTRATHDVVWGWNVETNQVSWNEAIQSMFGLPRQELEPGIESWSNRIHPEDKDRAVQGVQSVLQAGKDSWSDEYRFRRADGSYALVKHRGYILRGNPVKSTRMIGAMAEVSPDKPAEAGATEGDARREAQLRHAQKMESIGRLAGGVAHDFNNLLGVVRGYSALLLGEKDLKPDVAQALKEIASATERATQLSRQLLTVSCKQVIHPRTIDLNELIDRVGALLRRATGDNIALQFNYSPNLPPVEADSGMIEELVINLASNARDAMPQGGQLTVATKVHMIDEAYVTRHPEARLGRFVCLTVSDTGCGIDPATLERIFEPFFTTKPSGKGTGLSLAVVYGIAKQHQGWIEVQSREGQGATFHIYLPASSKTLEPRPEVENRPIIRGGSETILLVEDEPAVLAMAQGILQRMGYQVVPAGSGDEAASIWQQDPARIDLLLTDMVMPGSLNGRELAEKLVQERPGLKVVYTSGYSIDLVGPGLATKKDFVFIPKPYHPDALAQTVRNCLDGILP